ncbi:Tetratricopeptide repeat protein 17 [Geodia barretti]|uniref:Tetratricopeptide repeat protein 17 n=1 Tax=Geodia barretti TaxID=519541 RepID=A0AA35XJM8_GEOBA|nr:Tetratricopeptide repeat protein 17 [Geodia barretti]
MDHLYPVQYRSQLNSNNKHSENGLKQVFINAISEAMGQTMSFEECGEAVYAAMVKNGPNWGLFVVASLYWRVSGNPKHSIECLRRALHYSPNIVKDVGYIALANVFHRHGYVKEAVIAARASLDVLEKSPVGHYTVAGIYLSLKDYTSAGLHLRTALHLQPSFEHALSALRLVRCFLKFNEEYEQFQRKLSKPEGTPLKAFESVLVTDMVTAIETLRSQERVRQPPNVTKPDDVFEREGRKSAAELFTGEDALKYITNLAILRNKRRERETEEGESGRREREDIERRLREEMMKVELDGSLEEFLKKKRSEDGENEFEKKVHYEPNQLDITPLMQKVASRIQAEQNNYDPQLIAQSRAEIETELRDIVVASARAIANNQSPVQHTTPVRVIGNERGPHSTQLTQDEKGREDVKEERDGRKEESEEEGEREKDGGGREATEEPAKRERYPGFQPGQHCKSVPSCRCQRLFSLPVLGCLSRLRR